jgi:hypothetical protein
MSKKRKPDRPTGSHGVLITCERRYLRKAVHEAMKVCESILPERGAPAESEGLSLEEELAQVRGAPKKSRLIPYESIVGGNIFIRFVDAEDDPLVVVEGYLQSIRETGRSATTHVTRMYPILATGSPNPEKSLPVLQQLLPRFFTADDPITYEVVIQRKSTGDGQKESHDELNRRIIESVGPPHHAMYHGTEAAVLWLALGGAVYLSVVRRWGEWCGCNVPKFCARIKSGAADG